MAEQHKYFPSGIWDGFYLYGSGPASTRHEMYFHLNFSAGQVSGSGSDDVGTFTWSGNYNVKTYAVELVKSYATHRVFYRGMADENGIYGQWSIPAFTSGGFHLWPRTGQEEEEEVAEEVAAISLTFASRPAIL